MAAPSPVEKRKAARQQASKEKTDMLQLMRSMQEEISRLKITSLKGSTGDHDNGNHSGAQKQGQGQGQGQQENIAHIGASVARRTEAEAVSVVSEADVTSTAAIKQDNFSVPSSQQQQHKHRDLANANDNDYANSTARERGRGKDREIGRTGRSPEAMGTYIKGQWHTDLSQSGRGRGKEMGMSGRYPRAVSVESRTAGGWGVGGGGGGYGAGIVGNGSSNSGNNYKAGATKPQRRAQSLERGRRAGRSRAPPPMLRLTIEDNVIIPVEKERAIRHQPSFKSQYISSSNRSSSFI